MGQKNIYIVNRRDGIHKIRMKEPQLSDQLYAPCAKISPAKLRAQEVAAMPHIQEWIAEFQDICSRMPKELIAFVGDGNSLIALDKSGHRIINQKIPDEMFDPDAIVADFEGQFEGGGW